MDNKDHKEIINQLQIATLNMELMSLEQSDECHEETRKYSEELKYCLQKLNKLVPKNLK